MVGNSGDLNFNAAGAPERARPWHAWPGFCELANRARADHGLTMLGPSGHFLRTRTPITIMLSAARAGSATRLPAIPYSRAAGTAGSLTERLSQFPIHAGDAAPGPGFQ